MSTTISQNKHCVKSSDISIYISALRYLKSVHDYVNYFYINFQ